MQCTNVQYIFFLFFDRHNVAAFYLIINITHWIELLFNLPSPYIDNLLIHVLIQNVGVYLITVTQG